MRVCFVLTMSLLLCSCGDSTQKSAVEPCSQLAGHMWSVRAIRGVVGDGIIVVSGCVAGELLITDDSAPQGMTPEAPWSFSRRITISRDVATGKYKAWLDGDYVGESEVADDIRREAFEWFLKQAYSGISIGIVGEIDKRSWDNCDKKCP